MVSRKEARRDMIFAMGSRCAECGEVFDPDELIIHHVAFERGETLGYNNPERYDFIKRFMDTGRVPTPDEAQLLCDSCNRKRHGY